AAIITDEGRMTLRAGNMYVVPAFTSHTCSCEKEFEHYYIHLYNEAGPYILEDWDFPKEMQSDKSDVATIERLASLCPGMELSHTDPKAYDNHNSLVKRIELNKRRDIGTKIESRGLIYLLLSKFLKSATLKSYCRDERIRDSVRHIRSHLSTHLSIEGLAEMSHLSKDHFIRLFRKEMGTTPVNYITARRIEAAQLKLATETLSVKGIAYSLGYEDHAYFNRLFKKTTGLTPLQYRHSAAMPVS
ncbi:MAG: AraC family transcriptional regulator, partial [Muribaculaceae bacterium]|nr:AraC family transcriptional regulator [Muribaculaceae bacterium]